MWHETNRKPGPQIRSNRLHLKPRARGLVFRYIGVRCLADERRSCHLHRGNLEEWGDRAAWAVRAYLAFRD